jgi:hypothetical protein
MTHTMFDISVGWRHTVSGALAPGIPRAWWSSFVQRGAAENAEKRREAMRWLDRVPPAVVAKTAGWLDQNFPQPLCALFLRGSA